MNNRYKSQANVGSKSKIATHRPSGRRDNADGNSIMETRFETFLNVNLWKARKMGNDGGEYEQVLKNRYSVELMRAGSNFCVSTSISKEKEQPLTTLASLFNDGGFRSDERSSTSNVPTRRLHGIL